MSEIRPIERSSVHRIQSGQVIVDLCSVVKELVENSLDAGATAIDVRFKEHGLEAIEVQDNGSGIAKENYESIALKHYTSKLRTYEDLNTLHTFGFRGEALSSLCAVADVHLLTATGEEAPRGTRLDFDTAGQLTGTQVIAAQRGTLIVVGRLFRSLPVRRQELTKNVKREFAKVINLLQAYACGSVGVRFAVTNAVGKKKNSVFATKANPTVRENIANVFGARAVAALTPLELEFEMQSSGVRTTREEDRMVQIHGHVSKPIVGEGRQTPDRQMFFVNSRPCNLPQIAKTMNEVYKSYNLNQSPFIFANLVLDTNAYDVNVSPDKRQILLHEQGALLEALKEALTTRFDEQQQTVPQTQRPNSKLTGFQPPAFTKSPSTSSATGSGEHPRTRVAPASSNAQEEPTRAFTSPIPHHRSPERPTRQFPQSSPAPKGLIYEFLAPNSQDRRRPKAPIEAASSPRSGQSNSYSSPRASVVAASADNDPDLFITDPPISSEDFDLAEAAASTAPSHPTLETFNRRMRELRQNEESDAPDATPPSPEAPIPSLNSSPAKPHSGVVPNAFERMRPMRMPKQIATITIGDKSLQREIGSDFSSRRRSAGRATKRKSPIQTQFSSSLRAFAAPGSRLDKSDDEEERFQPDWPRRGPNRPARGSGAVRSGNGSSIQPHSSNSEDAISSDEELIAVGDGIMTHRDSITSAATGEGGADADLEGNPSSSDEEPDEEWLDEEAKRAKEDARVARMIRDAEAKAARPSADDVKRAHHLLRGGHRDATTRLLQNVTTNTVDIERQHLAFARTTEALAARHAHQQGGTDSEPASAEDKLSLSVSKADFGRMRVVGQFNLGFILAVRPGIRQGREGDEKDETDHAADELFIIDQHASDEKANFERLSATTVLQSQRLVHPRALELTAVEREVVARHADALTRNGFMVRLHDDEGDEENSEVASDEDAEVAEYNAAAKVSSPSEPQRNAHAGPSPRATLLALPASKETTFAPADLEELIALLPDDPRARPSRVRRLLAMRACRSSIMIGRALTQAQMRRVVQALGGLERPWNCPHGRPTMRHLCPLGPVGWEVWKEGERGGEMESEDQDEEEEEDEDEESRNGEDERVKNRSNSRKIRTYANGKGKVDWNAWLTDLTAEEDEDMGESGDVPPTQGQDEEEEDDDDEDEEDEGNEDGDGDDEL